MSPDAGDGGCWRQDGQSAFIGKGQVGAGKKRASSVCLDAHRHNRLTTAHQRLSGEARRVVDPAPSKAGSRLTACLKHPAFTLDQ